MSVDRSLSFVAVAGCSLKDSSFVWSSPVVLLLLVAGSRSNYCLLATVGALYKPSTVCQSRVNCKLPGPTQMFHTYVRRRQHKRLRKMLLHLVTSILANQLTVKVNPLTLLSTSYPLVMLMTLSTISYTCHRLSKCFRVGPIWDCLKIAGFVPGLQSISATGPWYCSVWSFSLRCWCSTKNCSWPPIT